MGGLLLNDLDETRPRAKDRPRTDAAVYMDGLTQSVEADFARTLERELAAMTKERDDAHSAIVGANWLLSGFVDAGGGSKALLKWAKLANDWTKVSCHQDQRDALRARLTAVEQDADALAEALEPFAKFACDEPHIGEPACYNCDAKVALAAHRAYITALSKWRAEKP